MAKVAHIPSSISFLFIGFELFFFGNIKMFVL